MAWKVALNNLNLIPTLLSILCITTNVVVRAQEKPTITTKDASTFTTVPNNTRAITDDGHSPTEIAAYPVVVFENHTYWPLSYVDNRFSFALVVTQNDAKKNYTYVNMTEAQGARYIKRIYANSAEEIVVFVGQGGREAAVSWEVLRRAAAVEDGKPAVSTESVTNTAAVSATSSAPPRPSTTGSAKGESITGAVAGGAFGGLVVLVVLVVMVWKCWLSPRKDPGKPGSSTHHTKGSVNLSTVSRTRTRDGNRTVTSLDDADERAAEARRLGGIPDWQAQTAYARAMSPVERGRGPRGGYHYPFKGEDRA